MFKLSWTLQLVLVNLRIRKKNVYFIVFVLAIIRHFFATKPSSLSNILSKLNGPLSKTHLYQAR